MLLQLLAFLPLCGYAQKPYVQQPSKPTASMVQPGKNTSINPSFPGGNDSLQRYLFMHIQTPDSLLSKDISGTIYFSFLVNVDGKLEKIKIEDGPPSRGWDSAAINCVRHMPNWVPGKVNGKPTAMRYFLPVYIPPGHALFNMPDSVNIK